MFAGKTVINKTVKVTTEHLKYFRMDTKNPMTNFSRLIKTFLLIKNIYVFWFLKFMKALCTLTQSLCGIVLIKTNSL